ncbi:MAG: DsrH/TusB family sulfur metabolism protein [Candidatus Nezhaarchaeales archaeon]
MVNLMLLVLALSSPQRLACNELFRILARKTIALYLASSGVYAAIRGNQIDNLVIEVIERGEVKVSLEDLKVRGLGIEMLIDGVKIPRDFYGDFVEKALQVKKVVVL